MALENGNGNGSWLKTVGVIATSAATGFGAAVGQTYLREPQAVHSNADAAADADVITRLGALEAGVAVNRARIEELRQLANERERRFQVIEARMDALMERTRGRP